MPHLLISISIATSAENTQCMVELCGPNLGGAHAAVEEALKGTGQDILRKPIVNGTTFTFAVDSFGAPRRSDVRLDRVLVLVSDALEQVGWALLTMTTDPSNNFFLMFNHTSKEEQTTVVADVVELDSSIESEDAGAGANVSVRAQAASRGADADTDADADTNNAAELVTQASSAKDS